MRTRLIGVLVLLGLLHSFAAAEVVTVKSLVGDSPRIGSLWTTDLTDAMTNVNPSRVWLRPKMPISGSQMVDALDRLRDNWYRVAVQRNQFIDLLPASSIHEFHDLNALARKLTFPTPQAQGRFTFALTTLAQGRPTIPTVDLQRWSIEHPWLTQKPIGFFNTSLVNAHLDNLRIDRRALAPRPIVPVVPIDPTLRLHAAHDFGRMVENLPVAPSSKQVTKLIAEGHEWQQIATRLETGKTGDAIRKQFTRNVLPRIERAAGTTLAELRLARPHLPRATFGQLLIELILMFAPLSGTTVLVISVFLLASSRS